MLVLETTELFILYMSLLFIRMPVFLFSSTSPMSPSLFLPIPHPCHPLYSFLYLTHVTLSISFLYLTHITLSIPSYTSPMSPSLFLPLPHPCHPLFLHLPHPCHPLYSFLYLTHVTLSIPSSTSPISPSLFLSPFLLNSKISLRLTHSITMDNGVNKYS